MARFINEQMVDDISLGASVLGTGGGGDPYLGALMAKYAMRNSAPILLKQLQEIADETLFIPCSSMGAPTVAIEKIISPQQIVRAFAVMEKTLGRQAAGTFPIEVGGINSLIPIIVAAQKGIPLIDCDGMGRAFPEAQMVTFYLDNLPSAPNTLADEKGNTLVLHPIDGGWSERLARVITEQMGVLAAMCDYPMLGKDLKQSAVPGTLTLAENIGKTLRLARQSGSDPIQAVTQVLGGYVIAMGKIVEVDRQTTGGFARGHVQLEGMGSDKGERFTLLFQNEWLLAYRSSCAAQPSADNLLAVVPDLISLLDRETGRPIVTEHVRYGQRVAVVASPCFDKWRTPRGLAVAGPGYFGYPVDYIPSEQLVKR